MRNWNNASPDYTEYIHSPEWREKADKRLAIDHHICQVCGDQATEVHHLTYQNFKDEDMSDVVSLCHDCHQKAEEIYDPAVTPWAMARHKINDYNFMAAMREDALNVSNIVIEYLIRKRGSFEALMGLRQPEDANNRQYWERLRKATDALCRKRYWYNCAEDRMDVVLLTLHNHIQVVCLGQIEHYTRNAIQAKLHDYVEFEYMLYGLWKSVDQNLGISKGTRTKFHKDDGSSFGPSVRELMFHYCALDAAAGIDPIEGFHNLSDNDYRALRNIADYVRTLSGDGKFKGEYCA